MDGLEKWLDSLKNQFRKYRFRAWKAKRAQTHRYMTAQYRTLMELKNKTQALRSKQWGHPVSKPTQGKGPGCHEKPFGLNLTVPQDHSTSNLVSEAGENEMWAIFLTSTIGGLCRFEGNINSIINNQYLSRQHCGREIRENEIKMMTFPSAEFTETL